MKWSTCSGSNDSCFNNIWTGWNIGACHYVPCRQYQGLSSHRKITLQSQSSFSLAHLVFLSSFLPYALLDPDVSVPGTLSNPQNQQTRLQLLSPSPAAMYSGMSHAITRISSTEGLRTLWRGVASVIVGAGPAHAVQFGTLEAVKEMLGKQEGSLAWVTTGLLYFPCYGPGSSLTLGSRMAWARPESTHADHTGFFCMPSAPLTIYLRNDRCRRSGCCNNQ